ncbi:MAG: hypothetical protein PVI01_08505 [Gemmatimonadales bacterium]
MGASRSAALTWYVGGGRGFEDRASATSATGVIERKAIAVLPFDNLSGDPEDEYFTAGIHEEIITRHAGIAVLKVISRGSVMQFKDRPASLNAVAERLGVDFVVEGSVRRAGDRVRITAQLVDARTDDHLWAEIYDRGLSDIFAVQSLETLYSQHEFPIMNAKASPRYAVSRSDPRFWDLMRKVGLE